MPPVETEEKTATVTPIVGNTAPLATLPAPGSSGYVAFKPVTFDAAMKDLLKRTYAPFGCTDLEFDFFIAFCERTGLDPVLKHAYLVKRSVQVANGNYVDKMEPMASEQGMAAKADSLPDFRGMLDGVVYEGDTFEIDYVAQTITHKTGALGKRGRLIGAWAHVQREGRRVPPTFIPIGERLQTKRDGTPTQTWQKMPATMILKCARAEQWRQGWPNIFGGQYVAEEMPLHEEIDVTPKAADSRSTTDKLADEIKGTKKLQCSGENHYTAAGAERCLCGKTNADGSSVVVEPKPPPASKATVTVEAKKPEPEKKPERKTGTEVVEGQRADMLEDVVTGGAPKTMGELDELARGLTALEIVHDAQRLAEDPAYAAEKAAELAKRRAATSNVVQLNPGKAAPPADPKARDHQQTEKTAVDNRPRMVFGKEHKGKLIEELDGPTILELLKRGNAQLSTLDDETKKAKVVLNLTQLREEMERRERAMLAAEEKAQNAPAPAREPGEDVD